MEQRELGLGEHASAFGERGVTKRLDALQRLAPMSGARLLDLGCANGTYTRRLAERFGSVDAVDIEPERLDEFRGWLKGSSLAAKIRVAEMSAERLDFDDATFDAVTTIEVLEHVQDLEASLAEIHRVLKPGGTFYLTSPNRFFPLETHGFLVGARRLPPIAGPFLPWIKPLHTRLADARAFTVRGITPVIARHGFDPVGHTFIMPPVDRSRAGQRLRPVLDRLEDSPLKMFGMALVMVFRKRGPVADATGTTDS